MAWQKPTATDISNAPASMRDELPANGIDSSENVVWPSGQQSKSECSGCGGTGYYLLAVRYGDPQFGQLRECEQCGLIAQRRAAQQETHTSALLAHLHGQLGRLTACTFDNFRVDRPLVPVDIDGVPYGLTVQRKAITQAVEACRRYVAAPEKWLYIFGPRGAGKSHLAAAIANELLRNGWEISYESLPELLAFVRKGIADGSSEDRIAALQAAPFLVLDDLGTEKFTPWAEETMFRVVEARSRHLRPTVFTSNGHYDVLPSFRIQSRLMELVRTIWLPMSDYRALANGGRDE